MIKIDSCWEINNSQRHLKGGAQQLVKTTNGFVNIYFQMLHDEFSVYEEGLQTQIN